MKKIAIAVLGAVLAVTGCSKKNAADAKITKEKGIESFRIVSNIGEQAQQSVFHLHFHVLSGRDMTWPPG